MMRLQVHKLVLPLLLILCSASLAAAQTTSQTQGRTAQAGTPAPLSNAQFWNLIATFSEEGGIFPSDNYTSNELMIGQVASDLIARGKTGGAYLGVGPEQNFTYISATRPDIVFIVDIRRQAVMQHLMYKAIFEMSATRSEFIARLFSKPLQTMMTRDTSIRDIWSKYVPIPADSALYHRNLAAIHDHLVRVRRLPLSREDSLSIALVYDTFYRYGPLISYSSRAGGPTIVQTPSPSSATFLSLTLITDTSGISRSFLASDESYQVVRALHQKNLFIPVVGNFGGPQALRRVGDFLRESGTRVVSYYTSNVEGYLFRPPVGGDPVWREYYTNVSLLPLDSSSIFIRSNGLRVNNATVLQNMVGLPNPPGTQWRVSAQFPNVTALQARGDSMRPPLAGYSSGVVNVTTAPTPPPAPPPVVQQPSLGSVTGTVTDSSTGQAVQLALVQILGTSAAAATDNSGRYTLMNVPPGRYTLDIRRVGYTVGNIDSVTVVAGAPTIVDYKASPIAFVVTNVVTARPSGGVEFAITPGNASRASVVFCPMLQFITAFNEGRIQTSNDVTACVR